MCLLRSCSISFLLVLYIICRSFTSIFSYCRGVFVQRIKSIWPITSFRVGIYLYYNFSCIVCLLFCRCGSNPFQKVVLNGKTIFCFGEFIRDYNFENLQPLDFGSGQGDPHSTLSYWAVFIPQLFLFQLVKKFKYMIYLCPRNVLLWHFPFLWWFHDTC